MKKPHEVVKEKLEEFSKFNELFLRRSINQPAFTFFYKDVRPNFISLTITVLESCLVILYPKSSKELNDSHQQDSDATGWEANGYKTAIDDLSNAITKEIELIKKLKNKDEEN